MKNLFLAAVILFLASAGANAQVEKGRFLVGGSADISSAYQGKNSSFNLSLAPSFGVFVVKGFAIGGRYSFGISSSKTYDKVKDEYNTVTTFTSGVGPLVRYYIGKKPLKGLISANVNYLTSTTLRKTSVSGTNGFSATGLVGFGYFFNPHLSLDCGLYVSGQGFEKQLPVTRIGFSVGLFAFLDKKKKE
jgi:hypothetical protein